ncbi:MAG: nucleoside hydrolase [Oscillospiraceae bacterium]|nr:nucleoside hydrolase [Oscillospiraceae bacterium]
MEKRKFLIDCDTGTDDAIAIMEALYEPRAEVVACTTVDGNVEVEYTSRNTLNLIDYLGFDIPVAVGAAEGMRLRYNYHGQDESTHGKKGLGPVVIPESQKAFSELRATQLIYEKAKECAGNLEILAIGPLTNIALALLEYPELKVLIKHLWIMGGAVYGGNVSTTAEFNIWADAEAGRVVFKSGIPLTMVGLDVTLKAVMLEEDARHLRAHNTKASNLAAELLEFMFRRRDEGHEDAVMHDALAFAAAFCPECLRTEKLYVDVECAGEYTWGHTFADLRGRLGRPANADVALGIDVEKFRKYLLDCYDRS